MFKADNNTKAIRSYMEALALHTGAPTVHWKDSDSVLYSYEEQEL